jgi:hypothetical protein
LVYILACTGPITGSNNADIGQLTYVIITPFNDGY